MHRGIALRDENHVIVQDEIATKKPCPVWWFMHTQATIEVREGGRVACLKYTWTRSPDASRGEATPPRPVL